MSDADQLKAYLAERDMPCPSCGYNLRDISESVCPECSAALSLVLAAERDGIVCYPRTSGVLDTIGQLGLACGFVLNALLTVSLVATFEPEFIALAGIAAIVTIVNGGLWSIWLRRRAWMGRQLPAVHVLLAFAGWWWVPAWVLGLQIATR